MKIDHQMRLMLAFFMVLFGAQAEAKEELVVHGAWVREAPPNAQTIAGYAIFKNNGAKSVELVSLNSPDFERVEFHVTTLEKGMMRMKHLESVLLKPGEQMEFEPGGRHLMLTGPKRRLRVGDIVSIKIGIVDGRVIEIEMPVKK